ncbi:MAG: hypothetical protein FWF69_00905, partial [Firmicutes bacterium]|nr:hypothetical protein [Bacillota bacterium]
MSAILRISIWGIVALILAAVLVIGLSGGNVFQDLIFGDFSIGNSFTFADAEEYTADGASLPVGASMDAIEIDWVAGKVNLRFTDTARIVFTEQANRDLKEHERLQYRLKNGRLSIQYCAPYRSLFSSMPSKTLEVEVPRAMRLA